MTIADLAPSLRPLVLLLSSDKPGEVAAAAAQITRRLSKAGLDWHDLADALEGAGNVAELRRPPTGAATCWAEVVEYLATLPADLAELLCDRDREFVASMQAITDRGFTPTEKQAAWLRGLFQRTGGAFAEEAA
ncbi:MAG TPA: hypothetical protein VMM55_07745 [Thermohalobaculum sp.]|nr:hypothetical protein [Thermohalobaculum sp.]